MLLPCSLYLGWHIALLKKKKKKKKASTFGVLQLIALNQVKSVYNSKNKLHGNMAIVGP
jgi:hypothetical protein